MAEVGEHVFQLFGRTTPRLHQRTIHFFDRGKVTRLQQMKLSLCVLELNVEAGASAGEAFDRAAIANMHLHKLVTWCDVSVWAPQHALDLLNRHLATDR